MIETPLSPLQKARRFMRYGYVSEPCWDVLGIFSSAEFKLKKMELSRMSRGDLIRQLDAAARGVFARVFETTPGPIVIPLSGGRDSRHILCMAREYGALSRVTALTWSNPEGLDWRISQAVARHFGVPHALIDTRRAEPSFEDLRAAYTAGAHWTDLLFAHFNRAWRAQSADGVAIIGYLGGPPLGSHYTLGDERLDFAGAVASFERLNARWPRGAPMIGDVRARLIDPERIGLAEQLDLVFRQEGYLRRIVAGPPGRVHTPYAHADWLRCAYGLPGEHRAGARLYSSYLLQTFPDAFEIGVSSAYGANAAVPPWRARLERRFLRLQHDLANKSRARNFATLDKYGDERDLLAMLRRALENATGRAFRRTALRPTSPAEAADIRARAMLACNLVFESEGTRAATANDAPTLAAY